MSDNEFRISRRTVLAGLGTIGIASAGAGLGTSAYFSDEETFENNQLTAGALDLKVDWEEHYSDWSADEAAGLTYGVYMRESAVPDGDEAMYVGFPDPDDPMIYIHREDVPTFMDATSIEAYPDDDDDGIQDDLVDYVACEEFADLNEDLHPEQGKMLRTNNEDTVIYGEDGETVVDYKPLVALDDVKPGDFGELTLSMHLCDNPGYIWLTGDLVEAAENGHTEPEAGDDDEVGAPDSTDPADVELLDAVQTMLWYDENGDNVLQTGGQGAPVCVQIVLDASGSMSGTRNAEAKSAAKLLAEEVINAGPDNSVGVTFFSAGGYSGGAQVQQSVGSADAQDVAATHGVIDSLPANGGSTAIGEGIRTADEDLANCPAGTTSVQIVITDGQNNTGTDPATAADDVTGSDADDYTDEIFAVGTGGATISSLEQFARPVDATHVGFADDPAELNQILGQIAQVLIGEEVFFRGSLRDLFEVLGEDIGIPLDGNRATAFDEVVADGNGGFDLGDPAAPERDPYVDSTTNAIGFAWYLPVDHANEIQTDSVTFDLGFYTEQARHNDGAGQDPQTPTPPA